MFKKLHYWWCRNSWLNEYVERKNGSVVSTIKRRHTIENWWGKVVSILSAPFLLVYVIYKFIKLKIRG